MRIEPVVSVYPMANPPRRQRGAVVLKHAKLEIVDTLTGERFAGAEMGTDAVWEKYRELNIIV